MDDVLVFLFYFLIKIMYFLVNGIYVWWLRVGLFGVFILFYIMVFIFSLKIFLDGSILDIFVIGKIEKKMGGGGKKMFFLIFLYI